MITAKRIWTRVAIVICVSLPYGCGKTTKSDTNGDNEKTQLDTPGKSASSVTADDLQKLAVAHMKFQKAGSRKAPSGWTELIDFAKANALDSNALQRVRDGGYKVYWNVKLRDVKMGLARFVLAYRPQDVSSGGQVLMYNGASKQVDGTQLKTMLARQDPTKSTGSLAAAPAGGRLVPLGNGRQYALKVFDDRASDIIVAYVVDGAGRRRVAIVTRTIAIKMGGYTTTFATHRDIGDPAGKTTRYAMSRAGHLETFRKGGAMTFEVEIEGKKLQGSANF